MTRGRYTTVKIPLELADKLDGCCRDMGYRSRAEMVDDAIRMFIVSMRRLETEKREQLAPRPLGRGN